MKIKVYTLITTSMFFKKLNRWIPVQCSWIHGLSESYYKFDFETLVGAGDEVELNSLMKPISCYICRDFPVTSKTC
ncbi:hypothetical protein VP01_6159g1 [Puccinia sorghi]|uniref:Uncharacterized protein n=1 Tax=Puccinia sorghi TaxID=27349 RepID=A0A0L6UGX1_9BASI|nr:hypothetical protein VP01_6159g1 [Puccinia sorghi]